MTTLFFRAALCAVAALPSVLPAQSRAHPPTPTTAAITEADLRTRVFIFADDSMQGREAGTPGHLRSIDYIARELRRLGLQPAGDSGTYFQSIPLVQRTLRESSRVAAGDAPLAMWSDVVAVRPGAVEGARTVWAGILTDSSTWIETGGAAGHVLVFQARGPLALPPLGEGSRFAGAKGVVIVVPDNVLQAYTNFLRRPRMVLKRDEPAGPIPVLLVSAGAAERLLGAAPAAATVGHAGRPLTVALEYEETVVPAKNVIAMLPGSDPALRGQYVAIGAHSDHDGIAATAVDHDSLRAFNGELERRTQAKGAPLSAEERRAIRVNVDSLRRVRPARLDSIYNGADDDASGSMATLEIAEAFARGAAKPKRSLLFVWHTAEEKGLLGADWYTAHPTVPRDSIVAQLNIDMIGRGGADDIPNGGPAYLQLIGSKRLSTQLGTLVETVNARRAQPFTFDYQFDAAGHPEQYYCRSDHYMYARYGIPVVFFSTGDHRDYHQLTDEPQYINYGNLLRVTQLIHDVAAEVANLPARPVVDQPVPPLGQPCRQ